MKYVPEYKRLKIDPVIMSPNKEEIISDQSNLFSKKENYKMKTLNAIIDNNEFVDLDNISFNSTEVIDEQENTESADLMPAINEYILMVMGKTVLIGSLLEVEYKLQSIIYKEDVEFKDTVIDTKDIIILKRIDFKVGVVIHE